MTKFEGAATVCEKCDCAIWVQHKSLQPKIERVKTSAGFFNFYYYTYNCSNCGNELDENQEESKRIRISGTNGKLDWHIPIGDGISWKSYASTHLTCIRCQKEDRNISYFSTDESLCVRAPHWYSVSYYGITSWGPRGGGPWMEDTLFCQDCHTKTDTEEWLKQTLGLVLVKKGRPSPHRISELAKEVRRDYPHIKLEPPPWG